MDDAELQAAGQLFHIGEDLYGASVAVLETRLTILQAEIERIDRELRKKAADLTKADDFFKKL